MPSFGSSHDAERADVARRFLRTLRRPQREVGERALGKFLIALEDDAVGYVCDRVEALGGAATVVLAYRGDLHVFAWHADQSTETPIFDTVRRQPVDPSAPIGLLVELFQNTGASLTFEVKEHRSVTLRGNHLLMAPA